MKTIERHESSVRGYCRSFPAVFDRAEGNHLYDEDGEAYLDFFAGAGALNYGHNPPELRAPLLDYLERGGVTHSLDLATAAKQELLQTLHEVVLAPRGLEYRVQFPGPTGTNAVEAALKLARKVTGHERVVFFTNAFHGMTLGSLAVTGNRAKRAAAGVPLGQGTPVPFDGYTAATDSLDLLDSLLADTSSGLDQPAAIILETVQAEGGVNVGSDRWLRGVAEIAARHGVLLIVDDIQVGCGRTGPFFSFERAGITPDLVCLSKSLSGYGLPFSLVLIRPDLDQWAPGEHNGTFRGHNLAFVTATAALETYWRDAELETATARKAGVVRARLEEIAADAGACEVRGRGLIQGIAFERTELAAAASRAAFERKLVIETAGPSDEVLKLLPPLTISDADLAVGLDRIAEAVQVALARSDAGRSAPLELATA
ncbi:MAG TPA: diaminobutyrate--2-oxoglutarate transaminase [Thermoanaerobaculia bacterium]|nr:diaminobutyrate--2-oxoglutarate transaminase [Thermoanaerobaculia bacterium]